MTTRKTPVILGWTIALLGATALGSGPDDPKPEAPKAEDVLRRTADYFKKAKSFAVEVEREQKVGQMSMKNVLEVSVERPNKLAIRTKGKLPGIDVVNDGKTLSISIQALKKYTQGQAPASLSNMGDDPMTRGILVGTLQGSLLAEFIADDPYKSIMEGVKAATYVGAEALDGAKAHHLKCIQDQFDWEVWIGAEGDPLLRKIVVDMTKSIANTPAAAQLKGQKLELIQTFKNWKVDAAVDEKAFAFQPPPGSQKVNSFFGAPGGGGREATSPLVGKPAPELGLKLLGGGELRLKDHRDKDILMLDFWATWCGPCVQELPLLTQVAESYKDKGVAFFGINVRETPEQIKKFQADKKLKFTVALDTDGAAGTAYGADAIPMLVLVDKKGIVQSVHVGYSPSIKTTLAKELDALLAGKDLAKEAADQAKAAQKSEGLERAWSVSGAYTSVTTDPKGRSIYAVDARGRCSVLDPDGKTIRAFPLQAGGNGLIARVAHQAGGSEGFFAFGGWGPSVAALKSDGTKLWEEVGGQGIDDVWAADLDGDGVDEAIVGYNGGTGLHAFSPDGKRLWKRTDLGNVWNVTAGDLDGDGNPEVVSTSAAGQIHVSAAKDGAPLATFDPGVYATKVRIAPGRAKGSSKGGLLIVVGTDREQKGEAILAIGGDHKALWMTKLQAPVASCQCLTVSPDGTRAALGFQGGRVCVVNLGSGRILGQVTGQGFNPVVAWATRGGGADDLLLVSANVAVSAFRVKPAPSSGTPRPGPPSQD